MGNDLSTLPNFPAEIRAPQGTLPGVSSFQLHFADHDVLTPGDAPDVLVAMNPAALKANLRDLPRGATLIVEHRRVQPAQPREGRLRRQPARGRQPRLLARPPGGPHLDHRRGARRLRGADPQGEGAGEEHVRPRPPVVDVHPADVRHRGVPREEVRRAAARSSRPTSRRCGRAGTTARRPRTSRRPSSCAPAPMPPGTYRNVTGNTALALGLVAASHRAGLPLVLGSYPITPASDILHALVRRSSATASRPSRPRTRSPASASRSAPPTAARSGVTTTSGPGIALKSETIGLAVSLELPLVVVDIQRGGPSTGLPTKTEQADLLQAMFGRNGESPGARRRGPDPGRLLRRRDGGGADRDDLPHAGRPALRRLPRERLRAVGRPGRGRAARRCTSSSRPSRTPPTTRASRSSGRTCATPRPSRGRGRSPARRGWSTGSAASRRPTSPVTSATTRTTTT